MLRIRKRSGLSRYRVSKDTGIPYSTLQRMEYEDSDWINIRYLKRLASYYKVRATDLLP